MLDLKFHNLKNFSEISFFKLKYLSHILVAFLCLNLQGQDITFRNISTNQGLSSNLVFNACQGPDGLLWIIANNRLDSYNEGVVNNYNNDLIPNIEDYALAEIMIDDSNIIWLRGTRGQFLYLDSNRILNDVVRPNALPNGILNFIKVKDGRVEVLAKEGHFYFDVENQKLDTIHLFETPIYTHRAIQISNEGEGKYLISASGKILLYDSKSGKVTYKFDKFRTIGAAMVNGQQILASTSNYHQLFLIDIKQDKVIKNLAIDIAKKFPHVNTYYRRIKHLDSDHIGITTGHQGLFIMNVHDFSVENYAHDFANPSSISSDNSYYLFANENGSVFVTSRTSGLNIFNLKRKNANHVKSFVDYKLNRIFEGHISHVSKDKSGIFWLSSAQGLLKYDMENNVSEINVRRHKNGTTLGITSIYLDKYDRKWISIAAGGVEVLDKKGRLIKSFKNNPDDPNSLVNNYIHSMTLGNDGKLWIGTNLGVQRVDLNTLKLEPTLEKDSLQIKTAQIKGIKTIGEETFVGSWRKVAYVFSNHGLQKISIPEEFGIREIASFGKDKEGRLYLGSQNGLFVSSIGVNSKYAIESKLLEERVLSIDTDDLGFLWIATENILYKYDPTKKEMEELTHENGFTGGGFRMHGSYMDSDGLLYYGMNTGMCFFNPKEMGSSEIKLNPHITGIFEGSNKKMISSDEEIFLPSQENNIGVYYQNIDIWNKHSIQYQYSVSDEEDEWIPAITNPILIQNIKSGNYYVRLRASIDGENWVNASNEIYLSIAYQWWRSWWVYGFSILFSFVTLYFATKFYLRLKAEKLEEKKYDESLKFFSFSMHKYADVDMEFWDVILECIRQLDIDSSSIYLLDKEKKYLIRQAMKANSTRNEEYIKRPSIISVDQEILGSMLEKGRPYVFNGLLSDKTDSDYKSNRHSKIYVPILSSDDILGVIDCEQYSKDYFNERRLSFLSAISTIVATKIEAYDAEQERNEAEISLSNNLKKVSELEMKSLRSQMNPHFMFNSLNSINNFIVKNDQENASDYLTNFAQLMRIILENSRQDWVSLESELKALRLYIDMEKLRFENLFFYHESIADEINIMTTLVPPMLIQPYVENAIWHGLLPKKSDQCNLKLNIELMGEFIHITIDDDGIGTKVSRQNKSSFNISKKSFGMKIISERIDMINEIYKLDASVQMFDKSDVSDNETGTRVILSMKLKMTEK